MYTNTQCTGIIKFVVKKDWSSNSYTMVAMIYRQLPLQDPNLFTLTVNASINHVSVYHSQLLMSTYTLELPLLASKLSWSCHIDKTVAKVGRNHAVC